MEKCRGVELSTVWDRITDYQKAKIVQRLIGYQVAFARITFTMYGSLYYSSDLVDVRQDQVLNALADSGVSEFGVGPTTDRKFFNQGRGDVNPDRGPCKQQR